MAKTKKNIFIICGEPSGDLLAGKLAGELKNLNPELKISGVGGVNLKQAGTDLFYDIQGLSVMGFFDVFKKLPLFFRLKKIILQEISSRSPDAIVLVDFSGFNLRLAKSINKKIPVIYYVSPQIWASRPGRIKTIKKFITKMIVIFKFEEELYTKAGVNVYFSGHPLLDTAKPSVSKNEFFNSLRLEENKTTIGLLPGSRRQEIKKILPIMLKAAEIIKKQIPDAQFLIAKSANIEFKTYEAFINQNNLNIRIVESKTCDCLNAADFSLVCSGTATLEAALIGKPFVIIYRMSLLNYLLYRPQIKVPYIGLVNLVARKKIIPEFIQFNATPGKIAAEAINILRNPALKEEITHNLQEFRTSLGETGASKKAAQSILEVL